MATLSKSLVKLRDQINKLAPNRSKSSDGWIGDPAHKARKSEHNEDEYGFVRALDITHDPRNGVDAGTLADAIRMSGDPRVYYVISNGRIANSGKPWRKYTGTNGHYQHFHVSVLKDPKIHNTDKPWALDGSMVKVDMTKPAIVERPYLVRGSKGDAVTELQKLLKITVDGEFGPKTEKAVIEYQKSKKITADGKVGPQTWSKLKP